jgi:uncharacterized coiled-coil DUF342 family protein
MDPSTVTREAVARQLVAKHEKALKVVQEEFEKYSISEKELERASEEYKTERDKLNERVQILKEDRKNYYTESRALRKEFMSQMGKKKAMADIPMEVLILTKQIDQLEWEIQTEALNVDVEKRMVKQIQMNLEKLHNYAEMYKIHEEVSSAVRKLTSKLNKKLHLTEKRHTEMLEAVNVSDEKHKNFVDAMMKLRDARAKRIGFQRDVEKHRKGVEHWKKVAETEERKQKTSSKQQKMAIEKEHTKAPKDKGEIQKKEQSVDQDKKTKPTIDQPSNDPTTSEHEGVNNGQ